MSDEVGAAQAASRRQHRHGLDQVGLARSVGPVEADMPAIELQRDRRIVAEILEREARQADLGRRTSLDGSVTHDGVPQTRSGISTYCAPVSLASSTRAGEAASLNSMRVSSLSICCATSSRYLALKPISIGSLS